MIRTIRCRVLTTQHATCRNCRAKARGCLLSILHCSTVQSVVTSLRRPRVSRLISMVDYMQYMGLLCLFSRGHWSPREDRVKLARDWLRRGGLARVALGRERGHTSGGHRAQPRVGREVQGTATPTADGATRLGLRRCRTEKSREAAVDTQHKARYTHLPCRHVCGDGGRAHCRRRAHG